MVPAEGVAWEGRGEIKHVAPGRPLQGAATALLQRGAVAERQPVHPQRVPPAVLFPFECLGRKVVCCGGSGNVSVGGVRDKRKEVEGRGGKKEMMEVRA